MIDFKLFGGFGDGQTDGQTDERTNERTDIGGCRVAFATEKDFFKGGPKKSKFSKKSNFFLTKSIV